MPHSKDSVASGFGEADTNLTSDDTSTLGAIRGKRASGDQATNMQYSTGTQSRWSKFTTRLSREFSAPPSLPGLLLCGAMAAGNYALVSKTLGIAEGVLTAYATYRYLTDVSDCTPISSDPGYIMIQGDHTDEGGPSVETEASRLSVEGTDVKP